MNYQNYMTGISVEHIMAKMDYDAISSDAQTYRKHKAEYQKKSLIALLMQKLGNLLISTGESIKHYAEQHEERTHHAAA